MPLIICHPDNWDALKTKLDQRLTDRPGWLFGEFRVRTDPHMDRDRPTGKYRLPDGTTVDKNKIVVKERFVEYGPEDVDWLIYAGIITEDRVMFFHLIDDEMIRMRYDFSPILSDRRMLMVAGS